MKQNGPTTPKVCKGCLVSYGCSIEVPQINQDLYCPCVNCIVKGMCTKECEAFIAYRQKSRDYFREMMKGG